MTENNKFCLFGYRESVSRRDLVEGLLGFDGNGNSINNALLERIAETTTDYDDLIFNHPEASDDLKAKIIDRDNDDTIDDFWKEGFKERYRCNQLIQPLNNTNCNTDILNELSKDADVIVRYHVAKHPGCPIELLNALSKDEYVSVRRGLMENPNIPTSLLEYLLKKDGYSVDNPKISVEMLIRLYEDDPSYGQFLAGRPDVPDEYFLKLATSKDPDVRAEVARNPRSTPEALALLAKDKKGWVLLSLSENPSLTEDIIKSLSKKKTLSAIVDEDLYDVTRVNNDILMEIISQNISSKAFENLYISQEDLLRQAKSDDSEIRLIIAKHPNAPTDALLNLLKDDDVFVARAALENPATPELAVLDYVDSIDTTDDEIVRKAFMYLAEKTPSVAVQKRLLSFGNTVLCKALSKNKSIHHEFIEAVFFGT